MRSVAAFSVLACTLGFLCALPAFLACDETPRGEQAILFLDDGSYYNVPPAAEAGPDAHGPCAEEAEAGVCAETSEGGVPYDHLIECTGSSPPFGIECLANGSAADGGIISYWCSTGVI